MRVVRHILLLFVGISLSTFGITPSLLAQDISPAPNNGFPPNAVFDASEFAAVQLNTGNLHIEIPIWSSTGRGLPVSFKYVYDSKGRTAKITCDRNGKNCSALIQAESANHLNPTLVGPYNFNFSYKTTSTFCVPDGVNTYTYRLLSNFVLREPDGTKHHFIPDTSTDSGNGEVCGEILAGTMYADDGSGFMAKMNPSDHSTTVYRSDGTQISYQGFGTSTGGSPLSITDPNGNQLLPVGNPYAFPPGPITDTLGRSVNQDGSYNDSQGQLRSPQTTTISVHFIQTDLCKFSGEGTCSEIPAGNSNLIHTLTLPNGQTYTFDYYQNMTGELQTLTLPSGGQISFTWVDGDVHGRRVASKTVTVGGNAYTWTYAGSVHSGESDITRITDPAGNDTNVTCSYLLDSCEVTQMQYYQGSATSGQLLKTVTTDYQLYECGNSMQETRLPIRKTIVWNQQNLQTKTETDWDIFNFALDPRSPNVTCPISWRNPVETREFGYGTGAPGVLVRRTDHNYLHLTNSTYRNVNIADRETSRIIYTATGTATAQTTISYDGGTLTATTSVPNHNYTSFGATFHTRGNPTTVSNWLNTTNSWLNTTNTYNDLGDLLSTADPLGHTTSITYTDNFTDGVNRNAQAFATQITQPLTNGVAHVERKQYYWNTYLPAASCGQNFPAASACATTASIPQPDYARFSYDLVGRTLNITRGDGGQTNFSYNDTVQPLAVSSTQSITSGASLAKTIVLDGMGRIKQSQLTSDPQGTTFTDTTYDSLGRVATVSNPYRSTADPTYGLTAYKYDALGRRCVVTPPDATPPTGTACPATQPANSIFLVYLGNCITVTDQVGKARKSCSDALGRLIQVLEDPTVLNYETDYTYDILDNLLTVNQKGGDPSSGNWRTRTFVYDSLSRLTSSTNPESNIQPVSPFALVPTTYLYDASGNLSTKTAPAPNQTGTATVTLTYCYDQLNRLTAKAYTPQTCSGGTLPSPVATYFYDQGAASANPIGRRTGMTDTAGSESWAYDTMGRPTTDQRTTNSVAKTTTYSYNFDGSVATLTYPSGRTITYTLALSGSNTAGRMSSAVDSTGPINYATGALYASTGFLSSLINGSSLVSTLYYNNRLQPCRISVKNTGTAPANCTDSITGNVLDFNYNFSLGTADNGNVTAITNNRDTTRSQSFTYDSLNRISTAKTTSTTGGTCWDEQFGYDPWANLLSIGRISGYTCSNEELLNLMATPQNRISGDTYDTAGNLTTVPSIGTYVYDAESHLTATAGLTYVYDGDGKRVEKASGGTATKLYWYGMGSDALDETDGSGSITNTGFFEYAFFGGKRIARRDSSNNVIYYFADHLGTARIVANSSGAGCYDADFYPFGGERSITNTCSQNYKFTGKERDTESGLDNFGARYDSSSIGRFMSPDPLLGSASISNPQTWNRYPYGLNNPLRIVDPTGLYDWDESAGGDMSDEDLQAIADDKHNKSHKWAQNVLNFRDRFRSGLDSADEAAGSSTLTDDEQSAAQAAVNVYGTEGDGNGVTVGTQSGHGASTILNDNDTISVKFGSSVRGDFLTATIAHEGAHVDQANSWLNGGESWVKDYNHDMREKGAWLVGSYVAQALGMKHYAPHGGGSEYQTWNRGWKAADVETLRAKGISNILTYMNLKPSDPDTFSNEHHHKDH